MRREIIILIVLLCIASVRYVFFTQVKPPFDGAVGKKVTVVGQVIYPPDIRLSNTRITLSIQNQTTNILLVIPNGSEFTYGDILKVTGILEVPENFITNAGKEFNYKQYLANQDIYYVIRNPETKIRSRSNGNGIYSMLYRIRQKFSNSIDGLLFPPESDLAEGLLLGSRGGFDDSMRDQFIATGTIHIVALSGYNVTIVAESVMKVLGILLAQTISILCGVVVIILFIILAGASATSIRAGIMAVIALSARLSGRKYNAGRALVVALILMIVYDPRVVTDISFQLSFLATFGVLYVTEKMVPVVRWVPIYGGLRELVATTLGATVTVLPILLYTTGILSLVSLPANILILPLIPLTMLSCFVTGIIGFVSFTLATPFAYISHILLSYILYVIDMFAQLPFAKVTIPSFPLVITLMLYVVIGYWVIQKKNQT